MQRSRSAGGNDRKDGKLFCGCGKPLAVSQCQVWLNPTAKPAVCLGARHADSSPLAPACEDAIRRQTVGGLPLTANGPVTRKAPTSGSEPLPSAGVPRPLVEIAPGWWSA